MAANNNPGAGRTWIKLTPKARRELAATDPLPVLRALAAQVAAHVPLIAWAGAWRASKPVDMKEDE